MYGQRLNHAVSPDEFMKKLWQFVGRPPGFRVRCGLTVVGAAFFFSPVKVTSLESKPQDLCQRSILHALNSDRAVVCVAVCAHGIAVLIPTSSLKNPVAGGQL